MPRCRLNKLSNLTKSSNSGLDALNKQLLVQYRDRKNGVDLTEKDSSISSTIQLRNRAFNTLNYLFNLTNLTERQENFLSEKNLLGIVSPDIIAPNCRDALINTDNLKNLPDKNKGNLNENLYIKHLKARLSLLAPHCKPKHVGVILSKFLEEDMDNLSINQLEYIHHLILTSQMDLSESEFGAICRGDSPDSENKPIIDMFSAFICKKQPECIA